MKIASDVKTFIDQNFSAADLSLDLNYSLTSSLRASVSINTDFAEVESDQRRVNLTRFPLRFPEQRDFFLEDKLICERVHKGMSARKGRGGKLVDMERVVTDFHQFLATRLFDLPPTEFFEEPDEAATGS